MIDKKLINQADALIEKGNGVLQTARPPQTDPSRRRLAGHDSRNDRTDFGSWTEWHSQTMTFLRGALGNEHTYAKEFETICSGTSRSDVEGGLGVLRAVREDIDSGNLARLPERVRADLFSDFLGMAEHLQADGFQDAAIVLGGGVLEEQLRLLCVKDGIPTTSGSKPKKAEIMNTELYSAGVYDLNQQKQVTAWLGIRNDPAHGNYERYTPQQVALFLASIRDFTTRHPA
jgi:hypothetical protein